jgi:D-amino-acid dehydrogenase
MSVVILGGGIVGVTTAYYLAQAGERVIVVDRQPEVALETSFANAGLISPGHSYTWASPQAPWVLLKSLFQDGQSLRLKGVPDWALCSWGLQFLKHCTNARAWENTSRKVRLAMYSQEQLRQLTSQANLSYEKTSKGLLYLHRDPEALARAVKNMEVLTNAGLTIEVLDPSQVAKREPALAGSGQHLAGALYCASDESGDARLFTLALYEKCRELGVQFRFDTTVQSLECQGDRVECVRTSDGPIKADQYVVAMGCYSPAIVRPLGYRIPIYPVKGYSVTFPVLSGSNVPTIGGLDEHNLIAWARFGNRLRFTSTAQFSGFDLTHSPADFRHTIAAARELFPDAADYTRPQYWAGLRPMTPDGLPVLGQSAHRNLFFNTGHGHLGWTWACGSARLVYDAMLGKASEIDTTGFGLR